LVQRQNTQLKIGTAALSREILAFATSRERQAPPRPQPATWLPDEDRILSYDAETARIFDARFGQRVRAAHNGLGLLGITDRDLDLLWKGPANDFQVRVVGNRLAVLSARIRPE